MDNGQDPFFTTDAGTNIEGANSFEPENNLDKSNQDWTTPLERDQRNLGNTALNSPEEQPKNQEIVAERPDFTRMGEVIDVNMPPGMDMGEDSISEDKTKPSDKKTLNINEVRGDRNRISKDTLLTVQKTVSNFNKGAINPAELADIKTEATEAYLKNTYGREYGKVA